MNSTVDVDVAAFIEEQTILCVLASLNLFCLHLTPCLQRCTRLLHHRHSWYVAHGLRIPLRSRCTSAALLMWHYLLTFDKEVAYFWRRRPNGACMLFLANRYLTIIVSIYDTPWWSLSTAYTVSSFVLFYATECLLGIRFQG